MYFYRQPIAILKHRNCSRLLPSTAKQCNDKTAQGNAAKDYSAASYRTQVANCTARAAGENFPAEYSGIVDLNCLSMLSLDELLYKLIKTFKEEDIKAHRSGYVMSCKKGGVKFELEVMRLECFWYLKIKKLAGNDELYSETLTKLFPKLNSRQ